MLIYDYCRQLEGCKWTLRIPGGRGSWEAAALNVGISRKFQQTSSTL